MTEHPTEETLHRFFDGAVSEMESEAIDTHIATCKKCSAMIEMLGEVREDLVHGIRSHLKDLDSNALFARIEAEIAKPQAKVIAFPTRRIAMVGVGVAFAAAAVMFFALRTDGGANDPVARQRTERVRTAVAQNGPRSQVEEVSFGDNSMGTIFEVSNGEEETVAVVWISDE